MTAPIATETACPSVMAIRRAGSGLERGAEGTSSGPFLVQMLLSSRKEGEMTAMRAFFDPGVVSHWHDHPCGQLLFVLDGVGIVQREGGDIIEVRAGDCVWFAPGERHWHGASPVGPFSYLSIQAVKDGATVNWFEPVGTKEDRS